MINSRTIGGAFLWVLIIVYVVCAQQSKGCFELKAAIRTGARILPIYFSPDGHYITQGDTRVLRIWNTETGKLVREFEGKEKSAWPAAFSSDGKLVAAASSNENIQIWEISSGKLLHILKTQFGDLTALAFSSDGKFLAASASDEKVLWGKGDNTSKIWDIKTGELVSSFRPEPLLANSVIFSNILFSRDNDYVVSVFEDQVGLWKAQTGKFMTFLAGTDIKEEYKKRLGSIGTIIKPIKISPDGSLLATVPFYDGRTQLWEIPSGKLFLDTGENAYSVDFSPNGKYLALGGKDKTARIWSINEKRVIKTLDGHKRNVRTVSYSADGAYISTADSDNTMVWSVPEWKLVGKISKGGFAVFAPTENILVTSTSKGFSNKLFLWNVKQNCTPQ